VVKTFAAFDEIVQNGWNPNAVWNIFPLHLGLRPKQIRPA
jgi:hypothetical protein